MVKLKDLEQFHEVDIIFHKNLEDNPDIWEFYEFLSEEDKQKCIEKNMVWVVKIFPFILAMSYSIAGSVIDDLISYMVNKIHEGWV